MNRDTLYLNLVVWFAWFEAIVGRLHEASRRSDSGGLIDRNTISSFLLRSM